MSFPRPNTRAAARHTASRPVSQEQIDRIFAKYRAVPAPAQQAPYQPVAYAAAEPLPVRVPVPSGKKWYTLLWAVLTYCASIVVKALKAVVNGIAWFGRHAIPTSLFRSYSRVLCFWRNDQSFHGITQGDQLALWIWVLCLLPGLVYFLRWGMSDYVPPPPPVGSNLLHLWNSTSSAFVEITYEALIEHASASTGVAIRTNAILAFPLGFLMGLSGRKHQALGAMNTMIQLGAVVHGSYNVFAKAKTFFTQLHLLLFAVGGVCGGYVSECCAFLWCCESERRPSRSLPTPAVDTAATDEPLTPTSTEPLETSDFSGFCDSAAAMAMSVVGHVPSAPATPTRSAVIRPAPPMSDPRHNRLSARRQQQLDEDRARLDALLHGSRAPETLDFDE